VYNKLYEGSVPDDRTARAVIRDEALRLFAAHGPGPVTIRQIAAAAKVSPGLVMHHFGSKEGLRQAVDDWVTTVFDELFRTIETADWADTAAGGSLAEAFLARLPPGSAVPGYLRQLLLSGDPAGQRLLRQWFDASRQILDTLTDTGRSRPSADPAVRAAFLMVNDLAVLLLRDQLAPLIGVDPLSPAGLNRWTEEVLAVYRDGIFTSGDQPNGDTHEGD
jgi:AcrR family transcriptional regulator